MLVIILIIMLTIMTINGSMYIYIHTCMHTYVCIYIYIHTCMHTAYCNHSHAISIHRAHVTVPEEAPPMSPSSSSGGVTTHGDIYIYIYIYILFILFSFDPDRGRPEGPPPHSNYTIVRYVRDDALYYAAIYYTIICHTIP